MAPRLRSPRQPRSRKTAASALADLASRRRASRKNSYRLSSRAERLLHHGDESDGESFAGRDRRRRSAEAAEGRERGHDHQASYEEEDDDDETATYVSHTFEATFEDDGSFEATFEGGSGETFEDDDTLEASFEEESPGAQTAASKGARSIFSADADLDDVMAHIERSNSSKAVPAVLSLADDDEEENEAEAHMADLAQEIYASPGAFDECPDDESPPMPQRKLYDDMGTPVSPLTPQDYGYDYDRNYYAGEGLRSECPEATSYEAAEEADGEEEATKAGNEALLFVCGHNANLYRDIFDLPVHATKYEIHRSYEEQMEQLSLAAEIMACPNAEAQRQAAVLVGMQRRHAGVLHPKNFVEIKRDAVRRAYDILIDDESRAEYDGLWREFEEGSRKGDEGTAETAPETDISSAEGGGGGKGADFWSEENTMEDGTYTQRDFAVGEGYPETDGVAYGSHGNYSYDCKEEDDEEKEEEHQDGRHYKGSDGYHYEGTNQGAEYDEDIDAASSHLEYSYHSEDEYGEDESEDEEYEDEEGGDYEPDYASIVEAIRAKGQHQPYSPTDPMEFDQLIQESLPDKEFFDQLSPEDRRKWHHHGYPKEEEEVFDPFDLRGGHRISPANSSSFPETAIQPAASVESVSFVCKLPTRDEDDEDELTMGDLIDGRKEPSTMADDLNRQDSLLDTDSHSVSTYGTADSRSLASSTQGSTKSKSRRFKNKVRSMVASVSGRSRSTDANDSVSSQLKDGILIPVEEELDGDERSVRASIEPEGPNMSDWDAEGGGDIDTFISAPPRNDSLKREGILRQSSLQCDDTSMCSVKTDASSVKSIYKSPRAKAEDGDVIDCFPDEEEAGRKVRFNINEEEEYEYSANVSVVSGASGVSGESSRRHRNGLDELAEDFGLAVDNALDAVERCCS